MKIIPLKVGDVVDLPVGFKVYATVTYDYEKWEDVNSDTRKKVKHTGTTQDVVELGKGLWVNYAHHDNPRTTAKSGEYVVVRASMEGGGTGMGPHDVYPDGHHVTLRKLHQGGSYDPSGEKVDFFQGGCFTAQHDEPIPVVRRMEHLETFVPYETHGSRNIRKRKW